MLALRSDEERAHQEQLAAVCTWGYLTDPFAYRCAHSSDTSSFDNKVRWVVKMALIIPWERRLAKMEISESQEATFRTRFGYRDYDRPFQYILVTLYGFD